MNDLEEEEAYKFIKANKNQLIEEFTKEIKRDDAPIIIFMAGSPGAGKTEIAKRLMLNFKNKPIRIDADDIRPFFKKYAGHNSELFQKASSKGVHILYDYSLKKNLNIILDGTFAYDGAISNVERALEKGYKVGIYFIYQNPKDSWLFTKEREKVEKRHVTKKIFINSFLESLKNVKKAKAEFKNKIDISLIIKGYKGDSFEKLFLNVDNIDKHVDQEYNEASLSDILEV